MVHVDMGCGDDMVMKIVLRLGHLFLQVFGVASCLNVRAQVKKGEEYVC